MDPHHVSLQFTPQKVNWNLKPFPLFKFLNLTVHVRVKFVSTICFGDVLNDSHRFDQVVSVGVSGYIFWDVGGLISRGSSVEYLRSERRSPLLTVKWGRFRHVSTQE